MPADESAFPSARLLIGVMTCRANRERERAVRRSWLAQPLPAGIGLLFVDGDGDEGVSRVEGDRLTLPVPDAYEMLPHKTRAFFRWAVANTHCRHILKCDDDSYLHVDTVSRLNMKGVDYAGRLTRPVHGIVETWHFGRCRDRSLEVPFEGPFPDLFAEGFAYFISREAATQVAEAADELVNAHILEDLFVGCCVASAPRLVRADLSAWVCARQAVWEERPGAYARHPLQPDAMLEIHRRFGAPPS